MNGDNLARMTNNMQIYANEGGGGGWDGKRGASLESSPESAQASAASLTDNPPLERR